MGTFAPPNGRQPMMPPPNFGGPQTPAMLPPSIPPAGGLPGFPALPTSNGPAGK
jgi:hypothetical protein